MAETKWVRKVEDIMRPAARDFSAVPVLHPARVKITILLSETTATLTEAASLAGGLNPNLVHYVFILISSIGTLRPPSRIKHLRNS